MSDLEHDCSKTFDQIRDDLERIEMELAQRFQIRRNIRRTLMAMDIRGDLLEDRLVADWHEAHSIYSDWVEMLAEESSRAPSEREPAYGQGVQEAAKAAFSFCASALRLGSACRWTKKSIGTSSAFFQG